MRCQINDAGTWPPICCEGEADHKGPHFRTIPKNAPNHPEAGQKRFFTGLDHLKEAGSEFFKVVKLANAQARAAFLAEQSAAQAADAAKLAAELETAVSQTPNPETP